MRPFVGWANPARHVKGARMNVAHVSLIDPTNGVRGFVFERLSEVLAAEANHFGDAIWARVEDEPIPAWVSEFVDGPVAFVVIGNDEGETGEVYVRVVDALEADPVRA